jgi:branched-chain amino acid aminotransferase
VEWDNFMGVEAREKGIRACVSSWARLAPNTMPSGIKAGGNYLSSQLITREAHRLGFDEGIGLSSDGTLSEGAGENLFIIRDDIIYTPTAGSSILCGITRDSVIQLANKLGLDVREQGMPREALYTADEIFMTGTAAEITPVRSVDDNEVRCGGRGPITKALQEAFFGLVDGTTEDEWGWWHPVKETISQTGNVTRLVM